MHQHIQNMQELVHDLGEIASQYGFDQVRKPSLDYSHSSQTDGGRRMAAFRQGDRDIVLSMDPGTDLAQVAIRELSQGEDIQADTEYNGDEPRWAFSISRYDETDLAHFHDTLEKKYGPDGI